MYQKCAGTCVLLVQMYRRPKVSNRTDTQVLPETLGRGFQVDPSFRIDEALAPLRDVVPMVFSFADVEVLCLTVHCVSKDKRFWIQPHRADPAWPQRKAAGEAEDDTGSDDHVRSSGSDGGPDKLSDLSQSNKDMFILLLIGRFGYGDGPRDVGRGIRSSGRGRRSFRWV